MDTTLEYARAKEVGQHEIQVDEIRRRARQWRLMDCDEDTLEQMRHALIEEMEAVLREVQKLADRADVLAARIEKGIVYANSKKPLHRQVAEPLVLKSV